MEYNYAYKGGGINALLCTNIIMENLSLNNNESFLAGGGMFL